MSVWLWGALAVVVYVIGFLLAGVIESRSCHNRSHPRNCNHPWETPAALLWPATIIVAPLILSFLGLAALARLLAGEAKP